MTKCRMCSQEVHVRGRICQECEWEIESARAWADAKETREPPAPSRVEAPGQDANTEAARPVLAAIVSQGDAAAQALPQPGVDRSSDALRAAAETSYNLWRTRRGAALLLAIAGSVALVGLSTLNPSTAPARATQSVMVAEPGMLGHCSNAASARSCLPSPPP